MTKLSFFTMGEENKVGMEILVQPDGFAAGQAISKQRSGSESCEKRGCLQSTRLGAGFVFRSDPHT